MPTELGFGTHKHSLVHELLRSEDVATADMAGASGTARQQLYTELASGAETGWDFSSRWLADGQNLTTIRTTQVQLAGLSYQHSWHFLPNHKPRGQYLSLQELADGSSLTAE